MNTATLSGYTEAEFTERHINHLLYASILYMRFISGHLAWGVVCHFGLTTK